MVIASAISTSTGTISVRPTVAETVVNPVLCETICHIQASPFAHVFLNKVKGIGGPTGTSTRKLRRSISSAPPSN